jgi:hypothetical protein
MSELERILLAGNVLSLQLFQLWEWQHLSESDDLS